MRRFPSLQSGRKLAFAAACLAACLAAPLSCGTNDVGPTGHAVGARCSADKDCAKRCLLGNAYPGGYCSQTCATDKDCPGGSVCIMTSTAAGAAGACIATCQVPGDCNGYGAGYQCNRLPRQESGAEGATVCTGA